MDKAQAKALQSERNEAAKPMLAKYGMVVKTASARFGPGEFSITIKSLSTDPALDPRVTDYERYAESFGLPKDGLGQTITVRQGTFRITGLDLNRRKYPVVVVNVATGKTMLFTEAGVRAALLRGLATPALRRTVVEA